jgi:hypothetical protein
MEKKRIDLAKCSRDVALVKKHAEICIQMKSGDVVKTLNPDPYIRSLAVIGPYYDAVTCLDEAVLLEVGLRRGKPYRKGESPKHSWVNGRPINLPGRNDSLKLTPEQYMAVAPYFLESLNDYATERILFQIHGWHDSRWVKIYVGSHKNKFTGVYSDYKWYQIPPSVRFAVSVKDEFLLSDFYWAELYGRDNIQQSISKRIQHMQRNLGRYTLRGRKNWPKDWMNKPGFAKAINILKSFPQYLQVYIWKEHFKLNHYFHYEIMEKIGYQGYSPWEEEIVEKVLPNPKERVGKYSIRVVRRTEKYVVFDFFPAEPPVEEDIPDSEK